MKSLLARIPGVPQLYHAALSRLRRWEYYRDLSRFRSLVQRSPNPNRFPIRNRDLYPCLFDKTSTTGFDHHYVYHTAWAARILAETRPTRHIDISSSLYFVGIASAFIPVEFYDYRPADLRLPNLTAAAADLVRLPFADRSVESLSCMHVVEHIGLGRYGDPLDPDGDLKAIAELQRVVAPGGTLIFVTPVGQPRICYNAHRIYSYEQICTAFAELTLHRFALVPDDAATRGIVELATQADSDRQTYGCGCFWFQRPTGSQL